MKRLKLFLPWIVLCCTTAFLIFTTLTFQVDDMTLAKGDIYNFNKNWTLCRADGSKETLSTLPYAGNSAKNETIVLENTIPKKYSGYTLFFLSADKTLQITIDGKMVYEFGIHNKQAFGHTPGSVVNFVDIPENMTTGKIQIKMTSSYKDYAANINKIQIAKRDTAILHLIINSSFQVICCILIFISGTIFALLALIQHFSKQTVSGMHFLSIYALDAFIYHLIETKLLSLYYGNQTLYSMLIFICLMLMPFLMVLYYQRSLLSDYSKRFTVLFALSCLNIFFQLTLQILDILDFMDMAFLSHGLILLTTMVIVVSFLQLYRKNPQKEIALSCFAMMTMGIGGIIDVIRTYQIQVGDLGKYSRYGTTLFCLIMVVVHLIQVAKNYSKSVEDNAKLLQREVENMDYQNKLLRAAKDEAELAKKEAMSANAAKGRFLANMSHEIRTPINAVLGMDEMILRESREEQIKDYAQDIQNAGQTLLSLINDILDFSKIESGKMEIIQAEYDISSTIHDIYNMIAFKADAKGLDFQITVEPTLPSRLYGDDVRIRQVLMNLLSNAVKYTHHGSIHLSITGTMKGETEILHCTVSDTGIGMKEEDLSRLTVAFERIDEEKNRNIEGTGLGMNITRQLLELMGSSLQVSSTYGKGSRFSFDLEQRIVNREVIGDFHIHAQEADDNSTEYQPAFVAPNAQILVVDDNTMNQKVLKGLLKETQMQITTAGSGTECLALAKLHPYDLIFLDHMMPDMDGVETLHHLKELKDSLCQDAPVIALTANAISGAREEYLTQGFDDYLAKPIIPDKLEALLQKWLPETLIQNAASQERSHINDTSSAALHTEEPLPDAVSIPQKNETTDKKTILPPVAGMHWDYALQHLPDEKLLIRLIQDFCKQCETDCTQLDTLFHDIGTEESWKAYQVKVHSMKTSAALIGALPLSDLAKYLEDAARNYNLTALTNSHDTFLAEWRTQTQKLSAIPGIKKVSENSYDVSSVLTLLDDMQTCIDLLDFRNAEKTLEQLQAFSYPVQIKTQLEDLKEALTNLDMERIPDMVHKFRNTISSNISSQ